MIRRFSLGLVALMLVPMGSLFAASDPRIRLLPYDVDQVVNLGISPGYAAVVELSSDEAVDSVVVGNSAVWQVTETDRGDRLVVKPLAGAVPTNMVVLTDQRRYVFLLDPTAMDGQSSFVVRFRYPSASPGAPPSARAVATYKFYGDKSLFPVRMQDDGRKTIVSWAKLTPLPATFSVESDHDALVNGKMIGDDYVIEGTAGRYKFKYGTAEAIAVRRLAKPHK